MLWRRELLGVRKRLPGDRETLRGYGTKNEAPQLREASITPAETSLTKFTGLSGLRMYTTLQSYGETSQDHSNDIQ